MCHINNSQYNRHGDWLGVRLGMSHATSRKLQTSTRLGHAGPVIGTLTRSPLVTSASDCPFHHCDSSSSSAAPHYALHSFCWSVNRYPPRLCSGRFQGLVPAPCLVISIVSVKAAMTSSTCGDCRAERNSNRNRVQHWRTGQLCLPVARISCVGTLSLGPALHLPRLLRRTLTYSNDALAEAAAELTSGVISADAVFGSLASIGCDWDAAVVVHMDDVSMILDSKVATADSPASRVSVAGHEPSIRKEEGRPPHSLSHSSQCRLTRLVSPSLG